MKKKYDIGILGVHGIGHQKEGDTYKNIVSPIIDDLKNTWEEDGTRYKIKYRNNSAEVRKGSERLIFEEVTWTPNYHKLPKNHIFWIFQNISILALIWGVYRYENKGNKNKFNYRNIIVSISLSLFLLISISLIIQLLITIDKFYILVILSIILIVFAVFCVFYLSSLSPSRIVHGAVNDSTEIKESIDKIKKKIYIMLEDCTEVIIAAHSQGGYMVYKALTDISRESEDSLKHVSFYGIGSGITPILLMQKLKISKIFISLSFSATIIGGISTLILWIIVALEKLNLIKRFDNNINISIPVILSILTIFAFSTYYLLGKNFIKKTQIVGESLNTIRFWEEYSAPEDIVGRSNLLFQKNSKIKTYMIPSDGYSIITHIKYFSDKSILPKIFTLSILGILYRRDSQYQKCLIYIKNNIFSWSNMAIKDKLTSNILVTIFGSVNIIILLIYKNKYNDDFWLLVLAIPFIAAIMFVVSLFFYSKGSKLKDLKSIYIYLVENKKNIYLSISIQIIISIILIVKYTFIMDDLYAHNEVSFIYNLILIVPTFYATTIGLPSWDNFYKKVLFGGSSVIFFLFSLKNFLDGIILLIILIDIIYALYIHYVLVNKASDGATIQKYKNYVCNIYIYKNNSRKNLGSKKVVTIISPFKTFIGKCTDICKYYTHE